MSIQFCCLLLASAVAVVFGQAENHPFAAEVKDCWIKNKPDDVKFNTCLLEFWKRNQAQIVKGIPEMKVPTLDPMKIANIEFREKATVVDVVAIFTDVLVTGVAKHVGKSVTVDRTKKTLTLNIYFPLLHITGNYDVKGTVLLTPVNGKGPFNLNMTDINASAVCHVVQNAGKIKCGTLDIDFTIGAMRFDLTGLLSQDTVGEAVINMLNDNSQEILADVKPKVQQQLAAGVMGVLDNGLLTVPTEAIGY